MELSLAYVTAQNEIQSLVDTYSHKFKVLQSISSTLQQLGRPLLYRNKVGSTYSLTVAREMSIVMAA